jgi:CRISPR-associated protein Cas6
MIYKHMSDYLEIEYHILGKSLPIDCAYALYSAIKKVVFENPDYSELIVDRTLPPELAIGNISGIASPTGTIYLNSNSRLKLRCPIGYSTLVYRLLQNRQIDVLGNAIRLVRPQMKLLEPSARLRSRLVTFKFDLPTGTSVTPEYFLLSCQRALARLEIQGTVYIDSNRQGDLARRTLRIKDKKIVGYGAVVEGLNAADSLKLQELGLGGRRHFGCGWFYPDGGIKR